MFTIQKPYLLFLGEADCPANAKTATGIAHFRPDDCTGYIKLESAKAELAGLPELTLQEAKAKGAKTLVIGVANCGGHIAENWIPLIIAALKEGFNIASGLHQKLEDVPIIKQVAKEHNVKLYNVRHYAGELKPATETKRSGKRILTVGTDCSVGKMYTTQIVVDRLVERGQKAKFIATGQTGILITGSGICIDAVVADFIPGAVEMIAPATEDDFYSVIEGQGSLSHPFFAGVSLGLLHGAQADYIVICHNPSRKRIRHTTSYAMPSVEETIELNLRLGSMTNSNIKAVGVSINSSEMNEEDALSYISDLEQKTGLPVTDPYRFGVNKIIDNIINA